MMKKIKTSLNLWDKQIPCVKFQRLMDTSEHSWYMTFTSADSGCYATCVGYCDDGNNVINVNYAECLSVPVITHLIGHSLGYFHEHTRPDRDQFVVVHMNNAVEGERKIFATRKEPGISYHKQKYDYGSIMHFAQNAYSKDEDLNTLDIADKYEYKSQGSPVLGAAEEPSKRDIIAMRRHYGCG